MSTGTKRKHGEKDVHVMLLAEVLEHMGEHSAQREERGIGGEARTHGRTFCSKRGENEENGIGGEA